MSAPETKELDKPPSHVDADDSRNAPREDVLQHSPAMRNSRGWDGKLRVPKATEFYNPEALSDPDYSDEDNVLHGQQIDADEDILESEASDSEEIICCHARVAAMSSLRLERFEKVVRLCFRQNNIQEISGLTSLAPTVKELDLYDNLIPRIHGLDDLTGLTTLDLSFNKIKHIKNISHLTQLRQLFLVANKISSIEGLEGLENLALLELGSNRIRELNNLDCLTKLEELWVAKNKITEVTGLGGLPNLRLLSIQSNRIRDLSPLKNVPSLQELYTSHNALESVEGLEKNVNLRVLDVSNNKIGSLKGLAGLSLLEELWASYNQLRDFSEAGSLLSDKKNLTTVYFEGNPLQLRGPTLYRNKVRLALPQVRQIDASECSGPSTLPREIACGTDPWAHTTMSRSFCKGVERVESKISTGETSILLARCLSAFGTDSRRQA